MSDANQIKDKLNIFFSGLKEILSSQKEHNKTHSLYYNVFDVLATQNNDEERIHTPFLTDLLNPKSNHGQDKLFLVSFMERFKLFEDKIKSIENQKISVAREVVTNHGRIDILIQYRDIENPFAIIIENKIDAGDQDLQLERYYQYLTQSLQLNDDQIKLVYLTKSGKAPSIPTSISQENYERLCQGQVLSLISYRNEIIEWLADVSKLIGSNANTLRYTIEQYSELLKTL